MGEKPKIFKISGLPDIKFNPGDPKHGMIVPQTALSFFKVGFEKIGRIPEILMSQLIFLNKPGDNWAGFFENDFLPKLVHKIRIYQGPATDKASVQNRRQHLKILAGEGNTLF